MEARAVGGIPALLESVRGVPACGATVKNSDSHHAAPWVLSPWTGVRAESRPG